MTTPNNAETEVAASIDDLLEDWLLGYGSSTRDTYRPCLSAWLVFCHTEHIEPLAARRRDVDRWSRHLGDEGLGLAPSTVAKHLAALSSFCNWLMGEDMIERSPVQYVRRPAKPESTSIGLTPDEYVMLAEAARRHGPRAFALVTLLGLTGLRVSEALGADVSCLGSARGHRILVVRRKGGRRERVALSPPVWRAIDAYLVGRADGPLFETSTGGRFDRVAAWRLLRLLASRSITDRSDDLHPHDLRHGFITASLDAGADLRDVQDAVGHADPRTTRIYDRARNVLDRHPTHTLARLLVEDSAVRVAS